MTTAATGRVTFGQLSVLRSLEHLAGPERADANLVDLLPVSPDVDVRAVTEAWLHLVRRNESLRTIIDTDGPQPRQEVRQFAPRPPEVVELDPDGSQPDGGDSGVYRAASAVARRYATRPFAIERDEPWRAIVTTYRGRPRYLAVVVHHVAADYGACAVLGTQLEDVLAGRELPDRPQLLELAEEQWSAQRREQSLEHWVSAWSRVRDGQWTGLDTTERVQVSLYSKPAMVAAQELAQKLRISVQSVVLAAAGLVLCRMRGRERTVFGLMAANRLQERWRTLVASMNQLAPFAVEPDLLATPEEFLRRIYTSSLDAYFHGCYDVDRLRQLLAEAGQPTCDPIAFDAYFNFVGGGGDRPADDDPLSTRVVWTPTSRRSGTGLNLTVALQDGLHLSARVSRQYLNPALAGTLLAAIEAALVDLASGVCATVAEVSLAPLRPSGGPAAAAMP